MKMQPSDYISITAIIISLLSLICSVYVVFRDRVNLKATSTYFPGHPEYNPTPYIHVKIFNKGRRVAIITKLGGQKNDGKWSATILNQRGGGIRLAENEFYQEKFYYDDIVNLPPEGDNSYVELWVEDSLGKRHKIINSRKNIKKLCN